MKISKDWLAEYVELPSTVEELAKGLTMAGLEVEGIHRPGEGLRGVVVAQIVASVQHPNADKLSVTQVDAGALGKLQIVCGAKNYQVGDKVPLATVGTRLPNGTEIKQAALRGVESSGMLCSARELGLSEEASGLLILDPAQKAGTPIAQALGLDEVILELNVTPNRPDALAHHGIAREVAAITGKALKPVDVKVKESGGAAAAKVKIRIEDPAGCPRYAGRVIENLTVGPSPEWLRRRLEACGVRSINNIVDVTNYVNLELGQPLHAFDLDKVGGAEIVVRRARKGEKLKTLDGKERMLDPDDLVIADQDRAQALAGTMGGEPTEVGHTTRRILLESACFHAPSVRRMSKRHGLHTEASHRFERGSDIDVVGTALDRAAALIAQLSSGTLLQGRVDVYPQPAPNRRVKLRYPRLDAVLGLAIPPAEARRILTALGFVAEGKGGATEETFAVPHARVDVDREEDLIEEVARIFGYDRIPESLPRGVSDLAPEPVEMQSERRVRQALSGAGLDEVVNYSFVSAPELPWTRSGALSELGQPPVSIALKNPLSAELAVMRVSLYSGLLQNLARNLRHQVQAVKLYEIGNVFAPDPQGGLEGRPVAHETLMIGGLLWGKRDARTWSVADVEVDFFDAKGAVEAVLGSLGLTDAVYAPAEEAPFHPRSCARILVGGKPVGILGELHPKAAKKLDVPAATYLFQLDAQALYTAARLLPQYVSLPKYPAVLRDLAVVVPLELRHEEIRGVIREVGGALVEEARVFDVYTGKPIPEGRKNVAYAISYRASERTLTDEEVNAAHTKIVDEVNRRLGASLRGSNP